LIYHSLVSKPHAQAVVENCFRIADKINSILEHEFHTHLIAFKQHQGSIPEDERGEHHVAFMNTITNQWVEIIKDQDHKGLNQVPFLESYQQQLRGVYILCKYARLLSLL
jgi:hypothetical protein